MTVKKQLNQLGQIEQLMLHFQESLTLVALIILSSLNLLRTKMNALSMGMI